MTHPRCEGLPGWECGRILSGREGHCFVHGDQEDRDARWKMNGYTKRDVEPLVGATRSTQRIRVERLPVQLTKHQQKAFDGFFEEDDRAIPSKPDVTRPPEKRKGNTRRGAARHTMTRREEKAWAKGMAS